MKNETNKVENEGDFYQSFMNALIAEATVDIVLANEIQKRDVDNRGHWANFKRITQSKPIETLGA